MKVNNPTIKYKKELEKREWIKRYRKLAGLEKTNLDIMITDYIPLIK